MLGKLFKYEFKSTAKVFSPLYITLLVVAIINGFFLNSEMFNIKGLLMMVFGALLIALFVITVVVLIQRFSKNLLGDEGYLMFTLPVKSSSIILSKYLVAILWTVLSGIVSVVAFFLITFIPLVMDGAINLSEYFGIFAEGLKIVFQSDYTTFVINIMLLVFISYSMFIFTVYLALSMGQLPVFNNHRNLASFISFIGINVLLSSIRNLLMTMFFKIFGEQVLFNIEINSLNDITTVINSGFIFGIVVNFVLLVGLFFGTKFILDKKLNLE